MKTTQLLLIVSSLLVLNGCSKDYSPSAKDTAESMYQNACVQCHQKTTEGTIFTFTAEKANVAYIQERIQSGSLMMPKFPNIKGESLNQLSDYILKNSVAN
ncbi:MAG: cytochrome c [Methylococcales bacterium]|nr:cytochrome c [Methylococcales bacterium]